jgi:hypothetical protein
MTLQAIDFAQAPRRVPRAGIALLVIGVLAVAATALLRHRWATEDEQARQVERLAEAARAQHRAPPAAMPPTIDEKRLLGVLAEQGRPWLPALQAVESATRDPVFLLSLTADASNRSLRLDAEAPSFDHALAYVQVLPDRTGLASASLLAHEQVTDASTGRAIVRSSVSARWGAP